MRGIVQFLRSRGWKRYLGSWWYKPMPGWDCPIPGQEIYGTASAFAEERLRLVARDGESLPAKADAPHPEEAPINPGPFVA
jgi:hypothetical protein